MGEGTSELRQEIEETRSRVGEEVEALSYKTDVGARLDDYVDEKKDAVTSTVSGAMDAVTSTVAGAKDAVGSAMPSRSAVGRRAGSLRRTARRNPLGAAVGAAAVGFVAGLLLPSTRAEDEHLGETSDRVKDSASEAGQEALERGKDVAQSAFQTVREEGAQQGRELASDLRERVQTETRADVPGGRSI